MSKNNWQERFKQAMLERRASLQKVLQNNLKTWKQEYQPAVEVVERASTDAADDLAAGLAEIESAELAQIDEALVRLDEGTYGECMDCGKTIPQKRLQLVPFALRCVDCERNRESNRRRRP